MRMEREPLWALAVSEFEIETMTGKEKKEGKEIVKVKLALSLRRCRAKIAPPEARSPKPEARSPKHYRRFFERVKRNLSYFIDFMSSR
jgi:hypothetical protein